MSEFTCDNETRTCVETFGLRPRAGDGIYEAMCRGHLKAHPEHVAFTVWGGKELLFKLNGHIPVQSADEARAAGGLLDHVDIARRWNKDLPPSEETLGVEDLEADLAAIAEWLRAPGSFGEGMPRTFSHHGQNIRRYALGGLIQAPEFCPIAPDVIRFTSYPLRNLPELPHWFKMRPPETYVEALQKVVLRVFEGSEIVDEWNGGQSFKLKTPKLHPKMYLAFNGHPRKYRAPVPPVLPYYAEKN